MQPSSAKLYSMSPYSMFIAATLTLAGVSFSPYLSAASANTKNQEVRSEQQNTTIDAHTGNVTQSKDVQKHSDTESENALEGRSTHENSASGSTTVTSPHGDQVRVEKEQKAKTEVEHSPDGVSVKSSTQEHSSGHTQTNP